MRNERADDQYRKLIQTILRDGEEVSTRNSKVKRLTGYSCVFDATPLVCLRKTAWKNALREWEWFMSGSSQIADLHESVRPWWQPWANREGCIGNNYSKQFRDFHGADERMSPIQLDQIAHLIDGIRHHPYSRRNLLSTWNAAEMAHPSTLITNCHGTIVQCFVSPQTDTVNIVMYQRSADVICGLPHNWIQYWAFLQWLAWRGGRSVNGQWIGRRVGRFQWIGGDVHIYDEHLPIVEEILSAESQDSPELEYLATSQDFRAEDFSLSREYRPVVQTKARMVV